jgi:hypothetical protein
VGIGAAAVRGTCCLQAGQLFGWRYAATRAHLLLNALREGRCRLWERAVWIATAEMLSVASCLHGGGMDPCW